jgi:elongation factor P
MSWIRLKREPTLDRTCRQARFSKETRAQAKAVRLYALTRPPEFDRDSASRPDFGGSKMQTILPSEFKRGTSILQDGVPHFIEDFHVSGTAQTRHKLHVRLRNLRTGRLVDRIFADNERVILSEVQHRRVQFSYQQGDTYVFSDAETFEELTLNATQIGDRRWFLKENDECKALLLEGKLLDIVVPPQVALQVSDTAAGQKGGSDAAWKPAQLETGLEIMLPLFIEKGDVVRVDTQTRKYLGKETGGHSA